MDQFLRQYLELLIIQYYGKSKATQEMTVIIENSYTVFNFLNDFRKQFDLDQASGDRLDKLGKIVGVTRIVENAIPKPYFGWVNGVAPLPMTFGSAPLFNLLTDSNYTFTQLTDAQMKFYIKAKAIVNATSAYLVHYDRISLQDAIQYLFNSQAFIVDNYNMSMTIYINDTIPAQDILLLESQNLFPKPQAVRLFLIQYEQGNTFGFAGNPYAKTFGMGKFARLITII
jgi:hypothetical protein